ncbi:homing endonuclease associated repeat-containing protein [Gordoniibacillus kamchatkensis]|uniref:homing endonuclease associated repeat-containing protein n=1 Tax=Gordoniibacillus kamchatkensis TaxID=1590651 RepID=UPI0006981FB5|nr:hypothetical protein [Paenibacillus sp. VKM B-2647]
MEFKLEEVHRFLSDDELINDLKRVAVVLNKTKITLEEYNANGKYHGTTLTRRFGSWFTCLELAGLQPTRSPINISEEELFDNLRSVWTVLGRQPRYDDLSPSISKYSVSTYEKRFGSWNNALRAFVEHANNMNES